MSAQLFVVATPIGHFDGRLPYSEKRKHQQACSGTSAGCCNGGVL